jgi:hypothetical protein
VIPAGRIQELLIVLNLAMRDYRVKPSWRSLTALAVQYGAGFPLPVAQAELDELAELRLGDVYIAAVNKEGRHG